MNFPLHETLANGLILSFEDHSNRYFGDYHRVCIKVCFTVEVSDNLFPSDEEKVLALKFLGREVRYEKSLQRMGVPSAQVEDVQSAMVDDFRATAHTYFSQMTFPETYVRRQLEQRRKRSAAY